MELSSQLFLCLVRHVLKISWKIRLPVFYVAGKHESRKLKKNIYTLYPSTLMQHSQNVPNCSVVSCSNYTDNFMKIRSSICQSFCQQAQIRPQNRKNPLSKGLNITSPRCIILLVVLCPAYAEKFTKIHSSLFHYIVDRQTKRRTKEQRWKHNLRCSVEVSKLPQNTKHELLCIYQLVYCGAHFLFC